MAKTNENYWLQQAGASYEQQQIWRSARGNTNYRVQEAWLASHLERLATQLGRPVRVLDFGCGFGRMAHVLAPLSFVKYYAYDFSLSMAEKLLNDPPPGARPVSERVRVAPSVVAAYPDVRFDVVFTVSVLIHNNRDDAAQTLSDILSRLDPTGYALLVENQLVPFGLKEGNWHGGCWVHDYVGDIARSYDTTVVRGVLPDHDVYLIRPVSSAQRQVLIIDGDSEPRALDDDERLRLGIPRLMIAQRALQDEIQASDLATLQARLHDLAEANDNLSRIVAERDSALQQQQRALEKLQVEHRNLRQVQDLRKALHRVVAEAHFETPPLHIVPNATSEGSGIVRTVDPEDSVARWQSVQDTKYANFDDRFSGVCHIFHNDWMGIRSAVGALPGWKYSISSTRNLPLQEVELFISRLSQHSIQKIVFHGISDPMYGLSRALAKVGFDLQYLVWHGTTAQWVWDDERRYAQKAIQMAREGKIRRFSAIRRGLGPVVGDRNFAPQLVNMPPRIEERLIQRQPSSHECNLLAPSWNDLRKNLATNVLAAQSVQRVKKVYVIAKDFSMPNWLASKLEKIPYRSHTSMLELMATMDLVLNVTTIDCHPMVDLEAMSVGTPSIRGPLFLDGLEDHPYARMTTVENPMNVEDAAHCIERTLKTDPREVREMMNDYKLRLLELSRQRYMEFLEI
ncbi:class I SAM-dependent methyltransferase [Paraburkholderia sp. RCC_158]|uniref:class I SAM-dependent methyltransferase n=1 Tax=Paraburkholderia sp. RCC_158 TaxID=3239220 RepID=UPI0035237E11